MGEYMGSSGDTVALISQSVAVIEILQK